MGIFNFRLGAGKPASRDVVIAVNFAKSHADTILDPGCSSGRLDSEFYFKLRAICRHHVFTVRFFPGPVGVFIECFSPRQLGDI